MKRVLVVAYFYPPVAGGGVYRTLGFARHLPSFGFDPVILTGSGSTPWVSDPELLQAVARVEVVRAEGGRTAAAIRRGGVSRPAWKEALAHFAPWVAIPDAYAGWRRSAERAGLARIRQGGIDAIYSTSPPDTDHLIALTLHRQSGLPWVADFRDPWIGLSYRRPPTPWHRAAHERMLGDVLREATRVVAAAEGTKAWLAAADRGAAGTASSDASGGEGAPTLEARLSVISNGFEAEEWAGVVPRRFDRFTVVHAGRLSGERTLRPFLDGLAVFLARDASRRAATQCLLLGPHDHGQSLLVERSGLGDVIRFAGQVPHAETLQMEAGANVLLLVQSASREYRDLVPGKLYEYLGAGRPVLAIGFPESLAADLVRRLGAGWVSTPDDPAGIADALELAWTGKFTPRHSAEECARYTRRALAGELARVFGAIT